MTAYIYKQNGIYRALSESGYIVGAWQFNSDKSAKKFIPEWLAKDGFESDWVTEYWKDNRVFQAQRLYEINYPGATFDGWCGISL